MVDDARKTRQQLIDELNYLRLCLTQFEKAEAEYQEAIELLRSQVFIDELTGLYNRRGFLVLGEQQINIGKRINKQVLLLYFDLDDLKQINDTFGHAAGDRVLVDTATVLKRAFRETDIIGRIGGDEFVALATINEASDKSVLTSQLYKAIDAYNSKEQSGYKLSLSIGTAICDPHQPVSITELMRLADESMYSLKRSQGV